MKLGRPGIAVVTIALALAIPLGTGAAATSSGVQTKGSISGTITGQGGVAIAGACVSLQTNNQAPPVTHTDLSGVYSFANLAASPIDGYAVAVDPACSSDPVAYNHLPKSSSVVYVAVGLTTTVNMSLDLGGSAHGVVLDAAGNPLAGVCVGAYLLDNPSFARGYTQSAADGSYVLKGLAPGIYRVQFDGCYDSQHVGPDVQPESYAAASANGTQAMDFSSLTIVAGQSTGLVTQRTRPGADIAISISNPASQVIPGIEPNVLPISPSTALNADGVANGRGLDGYWRFKDLVPGTYEVSYSYCGDPSGICRTGPIGWYRGIGPQGGPGLATPISTVTGATATLSDTIPVPDDVASTTTVAAGGQAVTGQAVALQVHVAAAPGTHIPSGEVYFSDPDSSVSQPFMPAILDSGGNGSLTWIGLTGHHTIVIGYNGDGDTSASFGTIGLDVAATASSGSGGGGGGSAPASGSVTAGGTLTSDPSGTTPDASNPLVVGVTSPVGGAVTIDKTAPNTPIGHYSVLGVGATITAPTATPADPLHLTFQVFDGTLPAGSHPSDITVFRDGVAVAACTGVGATPDPCVASVTTSGGVTTFDVRSSHASTWDVEAAHVGRVAGPDRIATAVAVSQDSFPNGHAGAVVLARADDYPDALVGGPLAAAKNAPLLLTQGLQIPAATATELSRVLPAGGTVYVLGGTTAVPASVATQLTALGYQVVRYAGADRYTTAATVAEALGNPATVLLATGTNFPDALASGPAAAHVHGAILLTSGSTMPKVTSDYVAAAHTVYAIGGPAATAAPTAQAIVGTDRFATAAAVAAKFFPASKIAGIATGAGFPDALAGGVQLALLGAPLLLSSQATVPESTTGYLSSWFHTPLTNVYVYGGAAVLSDGVVSQLAAMSGS